MSPIEFALRKRRDVVANHALRDRDSAGHLTALQTAHRELESQIALLPSGTDPHFLHFLKNQSYEKALLFLEEKSGPL